ncbi:Probable ubiquitin-conjugating enzyme E2 25 [Linum grandiflorum]
MDLMTAVIVGADGTPYHDGLFFFDIFFPDCYPNVPPVGMQHFEDLVKGHFNKRANDIMVACKAYTAGAQKRIALRSAGLKFIQIFGGGEKG